VSNPTKIGGDWRAVLPVMEKAFRSMGMFDAANRARLKLEATEAAVAAGFGHVQDCEWYDRGRSERPYLWQSTRGGSTIAYFGSISVALQRDQMLMLWALLTCALFPNGVDAFETMRGLVSICYDDEGALKREFFSHDDEETL
jgi:hypothetical protein